LPAEIKISRFINADLIAAGLAPFVPQSADFRAGRLMPEVSEKHLFVLLNV
jgi:predicted ABC-type ATPase